MVDSFLLPNLVIPGVTKAGTSSLAWYLIQHPEVCPADRKEVNYFRPLRYGLPPTGSVEDYMRHFGRWNGEIYRLDASPSYFYGGKVLINAVRELLSDVRILLMLRDPTDRLWSSYRSKKERGKIDQGMTFRDFFETGRRLHATGEDRLRENHHYRTLGIGCYIDGVRDWFEAFDGRVRIVFFEDLVANPSRVVADVLEELGLDSSPAAGFDYAVRNVTIQPRSRSVNLLARQVNIRIDRYLRSRPQLKGHLRSAYLAVNAHKRQERLRPDDRVVVERFYASTNRALALDLGRRGYDALPAWLRPDGGPKAARRPKPRS